MRRVYKSFFQNSFNYSGRASRTEFFIVFFTIFAVGALSIVIPFIPGIKVIFALFDLIWTLPTIALTFRRFNDAGVSPIFAFIFWILPIVLKWMPIPAAIALGTSTVCLIATLIIAMMPSKNNMQKRNQTLA